jgi:hypothetical protein
MAAHVLCAPPHIAAAFCNAPSSQAGQQDPDIFFTDRPRECGLGQRNKEYLSIWADECPVLPAGPNGSGGRRSPLQAYGELMAAFRDAFHEQLGSLVEEVVVGAGPCGELRCVQRLRRLFFMDGGCGRC